MEVKQSNAATNLSGIEECKAMDVQEYNAATSHPDTEGHSQVGFDGQLRKLIASESLDFDSWTSLISETENTFPDSIETISLVYDSFLSKFPLCHLYWKRYANHMTRLCTVEKAVEIFERGVQLAPHCIGLWVEYCSFCTFAFEDPFDIRWLFKRGISYVGKDYLCHTLWDKFIEFEYSQQQWSSVAHLFIQTLRFPTKKLHIYYKNFKKFASLMEKEMNCENNCIIEVNEEALVDDVVKTTEKEIYHVIKDLEDSLDSSTKSKALKKYISIGEQFYRKAWRLNEKIYCFEDCIKRPFFHVKPLNDDQLGKWHQYLDFIEKQDDFEWAVKLYERCLITCANYPEFWMRYVEFTEANGGRELANFALERATQVFLKDLPVIHKFSSRFKEKIGDLSGARASYHQFNAESSSYVENVIKEANMEKRLGNLELASTVYENALKMVAEKQKLHTVPVLYVHFSRLKYMITGGSDAAINVIIDGIQHIPHSRLLLEELINFAMTHEGSRHLNKVDPIIAEAISPGTDVSQGLGHKDREDLSCLYLEFVDLWGTNDDIRKAWNRHIKLFPHLIRTTSYNNPTLSNQSLSVVSEGTKKGPFFMPNQPSVGQGPTNLIHLTAQAQGLLSLENRTMNSDRVSADPLQPNDDDKGALEGTQRLTHQVVVQPRDNEDASEPMELTHDSVHESQGDASGPIEPIRSAEASQQKPEPEEDNELKKNLNQISVENLSLDSLQKEPLVLTCTDSHEHDVPQETFASNIKMLNPSTASPKRSLAVDSAKIHNESDENESVVSPLSYEKLNHTNRDSGGARFEVHGHSQDPEQQQASPPQNQVQNVGQAGAAKVNTTSSGSLAVENVPVQGSISSSSQSQLYPRPGFSQPQAQMAQYPMQSGDQLGHIQNSQAYNQMLQSYYQQQLMQQQYQQQLLQLQPYLQRQQQHEQMVQHQQYLQGHQQIQGPTDQAQQYMLYMQQQQYMQQYQQQQYQQQAQQYQQQLAQQYNLQGEQGYQPVQMLQQQQQQQQIPLSYYQQGQGIGAASTANVAGPSESLKPQPHTPTQLPPTASAPRPSVSPHSRLQSPPPRGAGGKSRTSRSPSLGHPSPKKG